MKEPDAVELLKAEVEFLKLEIKALEDGTGLTNVQEQFEAQLKLERAAGRTEALKPLQEIYLRGRLTFRSDGNPDSVEAQEREFRAAVRAGEGK